MRTFKESEKSQKTVRSMIEVKGGDKGKEPSSKKNKNAKKEGKSCFSQATYSCVDHNPHPDDAISQLLQPSL